MSDSAFSKDNRWLLPEGVDELLPGQAAQMEALRRRLLDQFGAWGYELVMPPFIEYLDSLLTGTGHDLDVQTFKLTDQLTGRLMGVRADITPQVARIDAHRLRRDAPSRLCYIGSVLHARPEGISRSRNPVQVGAELFGHAGVESDVEIISLAVASLRTAGIAQPHLDLGHVGIFRGLARAAGCNAAQEGALLEALQRKAVAEIDELLDGAAIDQPWRRMLRALPRLNGGIEALDHAGEVLAEAPQGVRQALRNLWGVAAGLERRLPDLPLHFDLAELRGYGYHTGIVFAALVPGYGSEVARGGRYDDIGRVFGNPRPATGFSADLRTLVQVSSGLPDVSGAQGVLAPWGDEPGLMRAIEALRAEGERVVQELPGQQGGAAAQGCDRRLQQDEQGGWVTRPL